MGGPARRRLGVGKLIRAVGLGLLLAVSAGPARADLAGDVELLTLSWSAFGRVKRLTPRLLERGDVVPLLLPADATDPTTGGCVTVAIVAPTSVHFVVDFYAGPPEATDLPEGSLAGAVQISRCGARKAQLQQIAVEIRSPRGLLEVLTVTSGAPLPRLVQILPHRDPGPIAPIAGSGPRPSAAPLALRLRAIEEAAKREQAVEFTTEELVASARGNGEKLTALGPGCHRFDLLADETTTQRTRAVDLDLEIAGAQTGEVLVTDRSEGTDASVFLCLGRPSPVSVRYAGALPRGVSRLVRTRWELEPNLPREWEPAARAAFSAVLRRHKVKLSDAGLVDAGLGVQGSTTLPFQAEPGACYVAAAVRLRGESHGISLSASAGAGASHNRANSDAAGTALAFCASSSDPARLEVDSRGLGLVWMFALFQTGRIELGQGTP